MELEPIWPERPLGNTGPLHRVGSSLLASHMEHRCSLAGVVDDDVVDVVVVYDIRDVPSTYLLSLGALLRAARRWASTTHAEPLAVRISGTFKPTVVFALFSH